MSSILLVRHGQASFGAADYDELSPTGHEQARVLGAALASRGVAPDVVVAGGMKRHSQTATGVLDGSGWTTEVAVDAGWDEFDHVQVLAVHDRPTSVEGETGRVAFQRWFEEATLSWTSGGHDGAYDEPFAAFTDRVGASLARLTDSLPRKGSAVVVTSGGPIAWAVATLLADDPAVRTGLWLRLNPVSVNSGVSTVVRGSRGTTLVSFNAHDHLSADLLTYR
ncbi:histidine phosphatase family protein [Nocardioides hwasunensis]|uniref:Histidine phosphatase family protein n=1 Tax=Nocardioides hwasunensis TaxID=397258 RepID=A0ABR8MJ64_9ACTN|nr:histidine phosphatase family protein [Nocardioides hwasunensis]MBD3915963.1 histidine phosphatase family protein [Nocardioides hwasunensis]